jgi:hypothetical protein
MAIQKSPMPSPYMNIPGFSGFHRDADSPVLVDYSAILLHPQPTGNPTPMLVIDISTTHTLDQVISTIQAFVRSENFQARVEGVVEQRVKEMQLGIKWFHGFEIGCNVLLDHGSFRRSLQLMSIRGFKDHFVVLKSEPYKRLLEAEEEDIPGDRKEDEGTDENEKAKEKLPGTFELIAQQFGTTLTELMKALDAKYNSE